jgi:hypothetical protein
VGDDVRPLPAEGADERGDVRGQGRRVVGPASLRLAVAPQVGRDRAEAGARERGQLRAPGARQLREAVQEQDEPAVERTVGERVKADAVRVEPQLLQDTSLPDD